MPRPPGLTPREYGFLLADRLTAPLEAVNVMTAAYIQARYGSETPVAAMAAEVAESVGSH